MNLKKIETLKSDASMIDFLAGEISSSTDMEKIAVIFPNIRPGFYLKQKIFDINKKELMLPDVYSIDDFIMKNLFKKEFFSFIETIDMVCLLYKNFKNQIDKFFSKNMSFDEFIGWGRIIINDFEELKINAVKPDELKIYDFLIKDAIKTARNAVMDDFEKISMIYRDFYDFLYKNKKFSRAMIYDEFLNILDSLNFDYDLIIFAGFFGFNKVEKEIFAKFYKMNSSRFVFMSHSILKEKISFLSDDIDISDGFKIPLKLHIRKTINKHHEIFSLKKNLSDSEIDDGDFDSETAIVLGDQSMILPLIENVLVDVKKFNISAGFSAKFSPIYSLIEVIKDCVDNSIKEKERRYYNFSRYFKLLTHQYIKSMFKDSVSLMKYYESRAVKFISLDEIEYEYPQVKDINNHLLKPFEEIKNIDDFLQKVYSSLSYIIKNSRLSAHPYWKTLFDITIEKIKETENREVSDLSFEMKKSYFEFLKSVLIDVKAPFIGTPIEGLQCIGFLESRGLKFKNLYILDLNDGIIPEKPDFKSFISDIIKRKLGISDRKYNLDIYRYYFETLISQAENVWIFYVDNSKNSQSPLVERIIWRCQKEKICLDEKMEDMPEISFESYLPQKIDKDERIKDILKNFRYSASSIDLYIECELKFYYRYILGIYEKTDIDESIDYLGYGRIVHKAFELIFKNLKGKEISVSNFKSIEEPGVIADKAVSEYIDKNSYEHYFIKKQISKRINDLLNYLIDSKKEYGIVSAEESDSDYFELSGDRIEVTAKADLIIEKDGNALIIDFKTSTDPKRYLPSFKAIDGGNYKKINSIQLPLYIKVFSKRKNFSSVNASIITVGSKNIEEKLCYDEGEFPRQKEIEKIILGIIKEIINKKTFDPPEKLNCADCEFYNICYNRVH